MHCNICNIKCNTQNSYSLHLSQIPDVILSDPSNFEIKSRYCKLCSLNCKTYSRFIAHLQNIHHTEHPYFDLVPDVNDKNNYCAACDKTFAMKGGYMRHLISSHLDKLPELYQGIDRNSLTKKEMKYKKECVDCQKVFLSIELYQAHMDRVHCVGIREYLSGVDDSNNHCASYDKTYSQKSAYQYHLSKVHKSSKSVLSRKCTTINNTTPSGDPLSKYCNVCDRVYETLEAYRHHMSKTTM